MTRSLCMIVAVLALLPSCRRADVSAVASEPAPAASQRSATAPPAAPAKSAPPRRIVAIGDLHADLDNALSVMRLAGLVDASGAWAGGDTVFVQTGDITDRGPDSKEVIELLMRLSKEAPAAGGRVVPVMGNHELMNMMGDWRYVTPEDVADFGSEAARKTAFSLDGELGRWLIAQDAVVQLGDLVFAHGGVSERFAGQGARGLSEAVRAAFLGAGPLDVIQDQGPLWYRGYLQADEPLACAELGRALPQLGARRMIVGHTTQRDGKVRARCGGQLLGIDTGIADHYGAHLAAVEILSGDARAIYASGAEDLPDP